MDISLLEQHWKKIFPAELVKQLLETYTETKGNFYLGKLRPNEVEGGRFAEAVFRILEHITTTKYTPLNKKIDSETTIRDLANKPSKSFHESIRLHIPRTLRVVYDIRNNRDAAHLADGIDPNLQDATLVCTCCDWVMAELIRLYHGMSADEAHKIVENLVTRKAPIVQEFGDRLKTLNPKMSVSDRVLVLLYHCGTSGATMDQLSGWVKPSQRANLRRCLTNLEHEKDTIILETNLYKITRLGQQEIENKLLAS